MIVAASGYFNPIHKGHIEYLRKAKELGDKLYVIVNSDLQVNLKGSKPFMDQYERLLIVQSIKWVDLAIVSIDTDKSVCRSIALLNPDIFAKGGDRYVGEIPEADICNKLGIKIVDGLGDKIQSSSALLKNII